MPLETTEITTSDLVVKFIDEEKKPITVENLKMVVEATKSLVVDDLEDKEKLSLVRQTRIQLRDIRTHITKYGLKLRADATAYNKEVIRVEKELLDVTVPEEERLAKIEEDAKQLAIRKERIEKLPARQERLKEIGVTVTDEALLDLDSEQFEAFFNKCVADNNEKARLLALEEQAKKEAELKREREELEKKQKEEQEKLEAERRAEQEKIDAEKKKLEEERAELARKEKELQDEKDRLAQEEERKKCEEADRLAEEEKQKKIAEEQKAILEKREQYKAFLISNGWTEETKGDFKVEDTPEGYVLFKKVGVFKK